MAPLRVPISIDTLSGGSRTAAITARLVSRVKQGGPSKNKAAASAHKSKSLSVEHSASQLAQTPDDRP